MEGWTNGVNAVSNTPLLQHSKRFPPCVFSGLAVFILKQDFKEAVLAATLIPSRAKHLGLD